MAAEIPVEDITSFRSHPALGGGDTGDRSAYEGQCWELQGRYR